MKILFSKIDHPNDALEFSLSAGQSSEVGCSPFCEVFIPSSWSPFMKQRFARITYEGDRVLIVPNDPGVPQAIEVPKTGHVEIAGWLRVSRS